MPTRNRPRGPVLVFAPIGRDGPATVDLLERAGIAAAVCLDFDALIAALDSDPSAVFVAEEGLFGKPIQQLTEWAARQQAWSDLPFVLLTSRHDEPRVAAWREALVSQLGNTSLLERPVQPITLVSVVRAAQRARERQLQIRSLLEAREQAAASLESVVIERTIELQELNTQLVKEMSERTRIEDNLRRAQKLEALGQLTGGVAHDFNNLLMVITAGLELMDRPLDPGRRTRMMQGMRQAAQRGASLTRQLLAFSRSHALRPETIDLKRHFLDMRELLDRSLRGDVQVKIGLDDDLWPVHVDPGELELVVLNLAVNARDAMDGAGVITVRAKNVAAGQGNTLAGDFVHLSVADTGSGMSDEVKAHVFEPFFTTKDIGKGSGLGLAQVYGFAQQSGGTVELDSVVGRGTTITLLLPRSEQALPAHVVHNAFVTDGGDFDGVVLMVEDDKEVAALVRDMLQDLGFSVVHAASAEAALGALADQRHVDLVFSDIMMPGGTSGVELAQEVRMRRPDLPILLTSGFAANNEAEIAELEITVLPKPYALDELRAAIARLLPPST